MPAERKPLISGNWKMNLNHFEATATLDKLRYLLTKDDYEAVDVSVHPPFTDIRTVQTFLESEKVPIAIGGGIAATNSPKPSARNAQISTAIALPCPCATRRSPGFGGLLAASA